MGALEDYKAKIGKGRRRDWEPPVLADFEADTEVLSFDQTLSQTGYVKLAVHLGEVQVTAKGTLRLKSELTGFEGNFDLADRLDAALVMLDVPGRWPDHILTEMPAVHGHRTDSSMLAAYVVRRYYQRWISRPQMVSIQESRTILAGPGARNDKKAGAAALARYIPASGTRKWNEHQRDAAINALAHLYKIKEGGR